MLNLNNKLLAIFLSVLLVSLAGCSEYDNGKVYTYRVSNNDSGENSGLTIYKVDGVEIECLWKGRGMSCNWDKYNKLKNME